MLAEPVLATYAKPRHHDDGAAQDPDCADVHRLTVSDSRFEVAWDTCYPVPPVGPRE